MFFSKGYSSAFCTGASPKFSCAVKALRAFIWRKLTLAALEQSGNVAGGPLEIWQPWRSLGPQNNLMGLLGDINKEE